MEAGIERQAGRESRRTSGRGIRKRLLGPARRWLQSRLLSVTRRYCLATPVGCIPRATPKLATEFRAGTSEDLARMQQSPRYDYAPAVVEYARARLASGDRLTVGIHDGAIVYYGWTMVGQMDLFMGDYVPLPANRAYNYKLWAVEEHRREGLFAGYYGHIAGWLASTGVTDVVTLVRADNGPSLRAHERAGFQRIGTVWEVTWLGRRRFVIPGGLRRALERPAGSGGASVAAADGEVSRS